MRSQASGQVQSPAPEVDTHSAVNLTREQRRFAGEGGGGQ